MARKTVQIAADILLDPQESFERAEARLAENDEVPTHYEFLRVVD